MQRGKYDIVLVKLTKIRLELEALRRHRRKGIGRYRDENADINHCKG